MVFFFSFAWRCWGMAQKYQDTRSPGGGWGREFRIRCITCHLLSRRVWYLIWSYIRLALYTFLGLCRVWSRKQAICRENHKYTVPDNVQQLHVQQPSKYKKTRGCQCSFRLLMIGGVSPETCWASYKYEIIKILIHFWILLDFLHELYCDGRIHERQIWIRTQAVLLHP
jgi:hypothetical protein